jgi:aldose 1-epimerase
MPVERRPFGRLDGKELGLFTIENGTGASLAVSDYGATAVRLSMPSPAGALADVILGFDSAEAYRGSETYFGATVGRFANRIRRGRFTLDGTPHQVSCNEGQNALHGGRDSYDRRPWAAEYDPADDSVTFALTSPDGDEGFPGTLQIRATYTLTDDQCMRIDMRATADRPTVCNLTHHSYFNLAGHDSGTVLDQELQLHSDFYTPVDEELIITGEVLKVAGTPFDFREPRTIGSQIAKLPRNEGAGRIEDGVGGYDHNFCLRGEPGTLRAVAKVRDPASGRGFELFTTEPGVHLYTGGYLGPSVIGKGGKPYCKFGGFTLETQKFPDGPNLRHVPQSRLDPGQLYHHIFELRFFR